jgi:hypothetical protein
LAFQSGAIVGGLIAGILCGLIPLGAGARQNRLGIALSGFVVCMVSGVLLGALLALPVAFAFKVFISATEGRATKFDKMYYG